MCHTASAFFIFILYAATYISSRCKSGRIGKKWTVGARVGIAAHAGTRMTIGALRLLHGRTQYMSGSAASRQETCAARHAGPRNSCNPLRQRCGARRRHRASEGCESRWRRRRSRASQVCCPSSVRCHPGSAEAAGASASLRVWFFLIVHLAEMEVAQKVKRLTVYGCHHSPKRLACPIEEPRHR